MKLEEKFIPDFMIKKVMRINKASDHDARKYLFQICVF